MSLSWISSCEDRSIQTKEPNQPDGVKKAEEVIELKYELIDRWSREGGRVKFRALILIEEVDITGKSSVRLHPPDHEKLGGFAWREAPIDAIRRQISGLSKNESLWIEATGRIKKVVANYQRNPVRDPAAIVEDLTVLSIAPGPKKTLPEFRGHEGK